MARFILFDIDGTLVDSGGAGSQALGLALEEMTGIKDGFRGINFAGKTDLLIMREVLTKLEIESTDMWMNDFLSRYLSHLQIAVHNGKGHVKPGISDLLVRLQEEEDCFLGLLTGNFEHGARVKLERFSLNPFFPVGAFGSDFEDRNLLLPVAVRRLADAIGVVLNYQECVVVGDTPRDVECAHAWGAACVAVATGPYSIEQLRETAADAVLHDLTDTENIIDWLRRQTDPHVKPE
jgi:phosphoglycolate phosphatase